MVTFEAVAVIERGKRGTIIAVSELSCIMLHCTTAVTVRPVLLLLSEGLLASSTDPVR